MLYYRACRPPDGGLRASEGPGITTPKTEAGFPDEAWPETTPQKVGWSSSRLSQAQAWAQQIGSTSVLVVQHGAIVAAWGDPDHKSNLHSARKSLLSALIGIAVAQGKIDPQATLAQLGVDCI